MTQPAPGLVSASQSAMRRMADRDTPFISGCWYVAALSEQVGRALSRKTILGKHLVFYRSTTGEVVALDDRCAHRSFPLSAGRLDGDTIVCGYHGFRYNSSGDVIDVPSQGNGKCPKGIGIRRYTVLERGPLVWIWMGHSEGAESRIPAQPWMETSAWNYSVGYMPLRGNYVSLHENLLDLTHLSYVHAGTFGTPDYARASFDSEVREDQFAVIRRAVPTQLPPIWAQATNLINTKTAARIARSAFLTPALHLTSVDFYESTLPPDERPEYHINVAHLLTPETHGSTHYFFVIGRDFALGDSAVHEFIHNNLIEAFKEDKAALEMLEEILRARGKHFCEFSVASDAAAVAMRRYLKAMADSELRG
jgi:vanillate O-demethylase monooxygenase subunit